MCGRYVTPDRASIERDFSLRPTEVDLFPLPRYNTAPTVQVPVLRHVAGDLRLRSMRWGLIPFFAKGVPNPKMTMHNARSETIQTSGAYRSPWKRSQRCIIPAKGFYEWHEDPVSGKHPFFIHDVEDHGFAFGGIWDSSTKADGTVIESCSIVTLKANPLLEHIHNAGANPGRMPLILPGERLRRWLTGSAEEAWEMVQPYPSEMMVAYQVKDRVNSVKNQGEDLLRPAAT
jgi:putative SOS response-associated peptidase YedK